MIQTISRVCIILTLVLPLACADLENPQPDAPTALIPLAVGNYWIYVDSSFNAARGIGTYSYTWSVVGTKTIRWAGQETQIYIFRWTDESGNADLYYRNCPDGLIRYNGDDSTGGAFETRLLKYPLHVGDTWKVDQGDYYNLMTCISTDTVISSQGRDFHCYQVRYVWVGGIDNWFYAEKFGLVARYTVDGKGATVLKTTLLSYRVQ